MFIQLSVLIIQVELVQVKLQKFSMWFLVLFFRIMKFIERQDIIVGTYILCD